MLVSRCYTIGTEIANSEMAEKENTVFNKQIIPVNFTWVLSERYKHSMAVSIWSGVRVAFASCSDVWRIYFTTLFISCVPDKAFVNWEHHRECGV